MSSERYVPSAEITLEMHLSASPAFTAKRWGHRVKNLGGRYSECRGDRDTRFVELPATRDGYLLADALLRDFRKYGCNKTTVVVRGYDLPNVHAAAIVAHVPDAATLRRKLARALRRRRVATPLVTRIRHEKRAIGALCTFLARLERTDMERALWHGQCALEANKWTARVRRCERRLERACTAKE